MAALFLLLKTNPFLRVTF